MYASVSIPGDNIKKSLAGNRRDASGNFSISLMNTSEMAWLRCQPDAQTRITPHSRRANKWAYPFPRIFDRIPVRNRRPLPGRLINADAFAENPLGGIT
jgi:hypothetical protein